MTDGYIETVAAIGSLAFITGYALYQGDHAVAEIGIGSIAVYLGAKAAAIRSHASDTTPNQ